MQRLTPAERAERLLSLIPWVLENGGQTIAELEERFAYPFDMLVADLQDVVHYLSPYPFTPDVSFSVFISDTDQVWIDNAEVFSRPPMFTFAQAFELFVAASAVLQTQVSSQSPLAEAVAKIAPDSSGDLTQMLRIDVGEDLSEGLWETLSTAVQEQRRVQIDYFTAGRNETNTRKVDAYGVFARAGSWHFRGWCHLAQGFRTFRCDQIELFQLLDEQFKFAEEESGGMLTYHADPDDPRAVIEVSPWAARLAEEYDVDAVEPTENGNIRMCLPIGRLIFLERLLLQAGSAVKVISTEDPLPEGDLITQQAARRVLSRYNRIPS